MASLIGAAVGVGQQGANNPGANVGSSWSQNFLDKFDPIGKFGTGLLGDPWNVYGQKNNPNALIFPSSTNANGLGNIPSVLPNLGDASMIPKMPGGAFMPLGQTNPIGGNGGGPFNDMAAFSAGNMFNPAASPKGVQPQQSAVSQTPQMGLLGQALGNMNQGFRQLPSQFYPNPQGR